MDLDVQAIADALGFDREDIEMLLAVFLRSSAKSLGELKVAVEANDMEGIYHAAHSIKGSAGTIKLDEIREFAAEVEMAGRFNTPMDFEDAYAKLAAMIDEVKTEVENL